MYLVGMYNYLLFNLGFLAEVFIYQEGLSWFLNHAKDLFFFYYSINWLYLRTV